LFFQFLLQNNILNSCFSFVLFLVTILTILITFFNLDKSNSNVNVWFLPGNFHIISILIYIFFINNFKILHANKIVLLTQEISVTPFSSFLLLYISYVLVTKQC
jgi:hypothetical protein